jgi:energy-coupling factor transport system permease protein
MINGASSAVSPLRPTLLGRPHPATRLAALVLGLISGMTAGPAGLAGLLLAVIAALAWTGLGWRQQLAALRPWVPVAVVVLIVHTLTTVSAAPLGRPSLAGILAGARALARVGASVGLLALYLRIASLDDLIAGTGWWLGPLRRLGVPVADLGLMLAVALGTAPVVLAEGRRIAMAVRMRRAQPGRTDVRSRLRRWRDQLEDKARLVVPLLESLSRRAEALSLSLRHRRPSADGGLGALPVGEGLFLAGWLGLLIWAPW